MLSFGALSLALERTAFGYTKDRSVVLAFGHEKIPVLLRTMSMTGLQVKLIVPDPMRQRWFGSALYAVHGVV